MSVKEQQSVVVEAGRAVLLGGLTVKFDSDLDVQGRTVPILVHVREAVLGKCVSHGGSLTEVLESTLELIGISRLGVKAVSLAEELVSVQITSSMTWSFMKNPEPMSVSTSSMTLNPRWL
jgi:hypothetical protein